MPEIASQSPEQWAGDAIDGQFRWAGWCVQSRRELDTNAAQGVAVRE